MATGKRPNFLFVLTDQQRFDSIGAAGNPFAHTPVQDSLARDGVYFTHCYAAQAVCSPSRASIFSGLFPTAHRVVDNIYDIDDVTSSDQFNMRVVWPGLLKEAGYRTGYIGKWHLGDKGPACYDEWYGFNSLLPHWLGEPQKSTYRVEMEADQAIDFLERNRTRPFALCLSHYPPHTPYTSPNRFAALYEHLPLRLKYYYGAVSAIDWHLGRVLNRLRELDLADNTVVIFTSDHGDHFGQRPGGSNKRGAYDECARVPLIFRAPRLIPGGQVRAELTSNVDLMPTILEMAGVQVPDERHGMSLVPLLMGKKPSWRSAVFIQNRESVGGKEPGSVESRAVRTSEWKLLMRDGLSDAARSLWELYDHRSDPLELESVFGPGNSEAVRELLVELNYWARQIKDRKAIRLSAACARELGI